MVTGELPTTNNDVFNSAGREYKEKIRKSLIKLEKPLRN